jgi:hypothetical protein
METSSALSRSLPVICHDLQPVILSSVKKMRWKRKSAVFSAATEPWRSRSISIVEATPAPVILSRKTLHWSVGLVDPPPLKALLTAYVHKF